MGFAQFKGPWKLMLSKNEPAATALCVACAGAGDGDTQAGPGGGEEEKRGAGEATAGGDEPQTEAGGAGGEAAGEAEVAGILLFSSYCCSNKVMDSCGTQLFFVSTVSDAEPLPPGEKGRLQPSRLHRGGRTQPRCLLPSGHH